MKRVLAVILCLFYAAMMVMAASCGHEKNHKQHITISSLAPGDSHTCAVLSDGSMKCWGANYSMQLGDGTTINDEPYPTKVLNITNAISAGTGYAFTCAVLATGKVNCWGDWKEEEEDLLALTDPRRGTGSPEEVSGISNAVKMCSLNDHTCVLLKDSTMMCWGANWDGQLGCGSSASLSFTHIPCQVSGLTGVVDFSCGANTTCAVLADGSVKCWGYNNFGQLGDGTYNTSSVPVSAGGIANAIGVAAGANHTCALLSDGTINCWGYNGYGELGDGTYNNSLAPVQTQGIADVVDVVAGDNYTCALLAGGTIQCWGFNGNGELGEGTTASSSNVPQTVVNISGVKSIAAGEDYTCAVASDGRGYCWGAADSGELGDGSDYSDHGYLMSVTGMTTGSKVVMGGYHTCWILQGSTVQCAGGNWVGQLGIGNFNNDQPIPTDSLAANNPLALSAGDYHTCEVLQTGEVDCWGYNYYGEVGNGNYTYQDSPVSTGIADAVDVGAGGYHTCAVLDGGTVLCWGANWDYQLGGGNSGSNYDTPQNFLSITNAKKVVGGYGHSCALLADGTVQCWGDDQYGQLGDGVFGMVDAPGAVAVTGISNAAMIDAGEYHTCALLADGTIKCWGYNFDGELGNNDWTDSAVPVQVAGINNAVSIAVGGSHSCALLADGTVKCWGNGDDGEFGFWMIADDTFSLVPVTIPGLTNVVSLSAGEYGTCAVLADGTSKCMGDNSYGELGNINTYFMASPAQVVNLP